jgi:hypothetical protein
MTSRDSYEKWASCVIEKWSGLQSVPHLVTAMRRAKVYKSIGTPIAGVCHARGVVLYAPSPLSFHQTLVGIDLLSQYAPRGITVLD